MRQFNTLVSFLLTWICSIQAANITEEASANKTKRALGTQTHYHGDPTGVKYNPVPVYHDSLSVATNPAGATFYTNSRPVIFHNPALKAEEGDPAKQVTVQQVVYEYQQTPHNAVSNVHVNQQFQTAPHTPDATYVQAAYQIAPINPHFVNQQHLLQVAPNQFSGVVAPVQHGAVIHHGQGQSKLYYNPTSAAQTTSIPLLQNNAQPKYIYANGKIVYHPLQNNPYPGVTLPSRPHNLVTNPGFQQRIPLVTQRPFKPSPLIPIVYGSNQVHPRPPVKIVDTPVKEEVDEEELNEKSEIREEQEEEDPEDHASYEAEEEDDFKPSYYSRYRFDDEEDDHESYREQEEEEDDDSTRSYTRNIRKKPKKYKSESKPSNRYHKKDQYKTRERHESNNKYSTKCKSPNDCYKYDLSNKKPKNQHKTFYYKSSSDTKPRKEIIEGRASQNIPIVHNKKLIRQEKWLITKKDDST